MDTYVLTIASQKGGVAKSTTAVSLAHVFAQDGPVLLIDLDGQANATINLGGQKDTNQKLLHALEHGKPLPEPVQLHGVDVVEGGSLLDTQLKHAAPSMALSASINQTDLSKYRWVIIDTPPALNIALVGALMVCDGVLIVTQCEPAGLDGLADLLKTVGTIKGIRPQLDVLGVLPTMVDRRNNLSDYVLDKLAQYPTLGVTQTHIPRQVDIPRAYRYQQPITLYKPKSSGAMAYTALARELTERRP